MAQDVLHLGRAVEGQVWMTLVHGSHDPTSVERGVEEVRVGEGHMAGAGLHQLVDIGHDRSHVHRAHAAVVHDRNRTVPAPVRATSTGLDGSDQALLAVDGESGIPVQGRQQVSGGHPRLDSGQLNRRARVLAVHPRHQTRSRTRRR